MMALLGCNKCKDTRHCSGKEWYSPGEIRYCRPQVIFILENLRLMQDGQYPRDPKGTSYTELRVFVRRGKHKGYFVTTVEIAGEVDLRLKHAYTDGLMLRNKYCDDYNEDTIAEHFKVSYQEALDRIESALVFVTGWYRKRMDYVHWKGQRRYRKKSK